MPYALCPMPDALCTSGTSCYARKAITRVNISRVKHTLSFALGMAQSSRIRF